MHGWVSTRGFHSCIVPTMFRPARPALLFGLLLALSSTISFAATCESHDVTITRDDWGIAHVHGHTDADAVFGMIYAQAEDDFNRIETNYLVSLGRLAEAEGESAIWQDLRQRLFIDPRHAASRLSARARPGSRS